MSHTLTPLNELIGKRVVVFEMKDETHPVPSGTHGTIYSVGLDVLCVRWDNGRNIYEVVEE